MASAGYRRIGFIENCFEQLNHLQKTYSDELRILDVIGTGKDGEPVIAEEQVINLM